VLRELHRPWVQALAISQLASKQQVNHSVKGGN